MAKQNNSIPQSLLVRNSSGAIDPVATTAKFAAELEALKAREADRVSKVADAVHAVFDEYPGASINMDAVGSLTAQKLGVSLEDMADTAEAARDYVRSNVSEFKIARGKGGGAKRLSDVPAEASEQQ